jgi:hypothetical protein
MRKHGISEVKSMTLGAFVAACALSVAPAMGNTRRLARCRQNG